MPIAGDEMVYVDDPRIKKRWHREVEGIDDVHFHNDARMPGIYARILQFRMWENEEVELEIPEGTKMLGIVTELASHHPSARVYINGVNETPNYLDTFMMGEIDSLGYIKWIMLPQQQNNSVRLQVTDRYNPIMPRAQRARNSGFCLSGFILKSDFQLPAPVYSTVTWKEHHLNETVVPKSPDGYTPGILEIGHITVAAELQFMRLSCDSDELEVMVCDGHYEQNESWSSTLREFYENVNHDSIPGYGKVLEWGGNKKTIALTQPVTTSTFMRIILRNHGTIDQRLLSLTCIAKVRLI